MRAVQSITEERRSGERKEEERRGLDRKRKKRGVEYFDEETRRDERRRDVW